MVTIIRSLGATLVSLFWSRAKLHHEILILRHQLNVLRRTSPERVALTNVDRQTITVAELADRFDKEHVALRVKASTAKEYRRNLKRIILPALGRHRVTEVTRADIAKFHNDLRDRLAGIGVASSPVDGEFSMTNSVRTESSSLAGALTPSWAVE